MESLANEDLCFAFVQELSKQWSGVLWQNDNPTAQEQTLIDELIDSEFTYRRVGYDERTITLGPDRQITSGSAKCERLWHINIVDGHPILTIARYDRPTCHLVQSINGLWKGHWLEHEKMPVELSNLDLSRNSSGSLTS